MDLELSEKIEVFCRDTGSGAQAPITVEGRGKADLRYTICARRVNRERDRADSHRDGGATRAGVTSARYCNSDSGGVR